jgi:hypothetical protein
MEGEDSDNEEEGQEHGRVVG